MWFYFWTLYSIPSACMSICASLILVLYLCHWRSTFTALGSCLVPDFRTNALTIWPLSIRLNIGLSHRSLLHWGRYAPSVSCFWIVRLVGWLCCFWFVVIKGFWALIKTYLTSVEMIYDSCPWICLCDMLCLLMRWTVHPWYKIILSPCMIFFCVCVICVWCVHAFNVSKCVHMYMRGHTCMWGDSQRSLVYVSVYCFTLYCLNRVSLI